MSKEELEKEVKLYLRQNFNSECYSDIEMIIGFAEPRENHIEILKKENAELERQNKKMKSLLKEIYEEYGFCELVKIRNELPLEVQEAIKISK